MFHTLLDQLGVGGVQIITDQHHILMLGSEAAGQVDPAGVILMLTSVVN